MKDKLIIGLGFQMGSGKDTVADMLCLHHGFQRVRFADALKDAACVIFGWDRAQLEDLDFKMTVDPFWGETPRAILQRFGTEAMRNNFLRDIWVKALERKIQQTQRTRIVIPDVRFWNEAEAITGWGGYTVRITRPGWKPPNATDEQMQHASETALLAYPGWDSGICNDGSLEQLETNTNIMFNVLSALHEDK